MTGKGANAMSEPKVIIAGWVTFDPKKRDAVVESFKDMVSRARRAPGCLDFSLTADPVDPGRVNNFEFWRSEKDLKAWRRACKSHKTVARMIRVEVQKHVVDKSGPPF
jgi:quinol monooxygenase YgiN